MLSVYGHFYFGCVAYFDFSWRKDPLTYTESMRSFVVFLHINFSFARFWILWSCFVFWMLIQDSLSGISKKCLFRPHFVYPGLSHLVIPVLENTYPVHVLLMLGLSGAYPDFVDGFFL